MLPNSVPPLAGMLPIRNGVVRFCIETPEGLTSNAWRVWVRQGSVYVACRDNFKEAKVSLHRGGRWRMAFTDTAAEKLVPTGEDRVWEKWTEPLPQLPGTVIAFRLFYPRSELAVRLEQRKPSEWTNVIHIEAAPAEKLTAATLFITAGEIGLTHDSEPSFCLASLDLGDGRRAQVIVHDEPEGNIPALIERSTATTRAQLEAEGTPIPSDAYSYLFGKMEDGSRFLVGARTLRGAA